MARFGFIAAILVLLAACEASWSYSTKNTPVMKPGVAEPSPSRGSASLSPTPAAAPTAAPAAQSAAPDSHPNDQADFDQAFARDQVERTATTDAGANTAVTCPPVPNADTNRAAVEPTDIAPGTYRTPDLAFEVIVEANGCAKYSAFRSASGTTTKTLEDENGYYQREYTRDYSCTIKGVIGPDRLIRPQVYSAIFCATRGARILSEDKPVVVRGTTLILTTDTHRQVILVRK